MRCTKFFLLFVLAWTIVFAPAQVSAEVTTVILVRHGQTTYNAQGRIQGFLDIPLSDNGIAQAKLLAKSLKDYPIDVFIASPLQRAYVTPNLSPKRTTKPLRTPTNAYAKSITATWPVSLSKNARLVSR